MFQDLLESRATRQRGGWGTAASAVLHGSVVALAVMATMRTGRAAPPDEALPKEIIYQATPAEPVRRPEPATAGPSAPGPVVPTLPTLPNLTVSEIPSTIPPAGEAIDQAAIDALNQGFRPGGSLVGAAGGGAGVAAVATDGVYDAHMVDKAVVSVGDNPIPRYPEMLRQASIGGTVLAQFVVDTLGRVDLRSIRVLRSDHELFSDAVRLNLPRMRFLPAQVGDRKVPQLVQMPFTFAVTDR